MLSDKSVLTFLASHKRKVEDDEPPPIPPRKPPRRFENAPTTAAEESEKQQKMVKNLQGMQNCLLTPAIFREGFQGPYFARIRVALLEGYLPTNIYNNSQKIT